MTTIRPALEAADRALILEQRRLSTIGHLRHTAREIAGNLFGISAETAEVVGLQDAMQKALDAFITSQRSPAAALAYIAPDQVKAKLTAMSESAKEAGDE
jgi:hypothetical protein